MNPSYQRLGDHDDEAADFSAGAQGSASQETFVSPLMGQHSLDGRQHSETNPSTVLPQHMLREDVLFGCLRQNKPFYPPADLPKGIARQANMAYIYKLSAFVSLGALLFGYDQGVMGVIVADARFRQLMQEPGPWVTGAIVSLYDIGCFVGALASGMLADMYGRERMLFLAATVCNFGAFLQATSYSVTQIILGRIILGLGVGGCAAGVPLYLSEIAPPWARGRLIGVEQMILCTGELIAFWLNYALNYLPHASWWRIPLAIQILPASALAFGCISGFVPPSPRWLVAQGRSEDALEILTRLHGTQTARVELEAMAKMMRQEAALSPSWATLLRQPALRLTLIAIGIQSFQQTTGTNSILYYSPSLFKKGGITDPHIANLATGGIGVVLFAASWIPIYVFDRLPRKTWLQMGTVGMCLAMLGIALLQRHAEAHPGARENYLIVIFPYLFYVCFNISWGPAAWTIASEMFPPALRARGNALAAAANWLSCYLVAQASPVLAERIRWGLYVVYALVCVVAWLFVRYVVVETRGLRLEDMGRVWGLDKSNGASAFVDDDDEEEDDEHAGKSDRPLEDETSDQSSHEN